MKKLIISWLFIIYIFSSITTNAKNKYSVTNGTITESKSGVVLTAKGNELYSWCSVDPKSIGLSLENAKNVVAKIKNSGSDDVNILLWAVGRNGWNCSAGAATVLAGESADVFCNLLAKFPDDTPMLDRNKISRIEVMILKPKDGAQVTITELNSCGYIAEPKQNIDRILVPEIYNCKAAAGKRVKYKLSSKSNLYGVLYLPKDWQKGKSYPMIVEYPGNIFYTAKCYSTGLPDQCTIGYGISKGEGVILLSLPFVDYSSNTVVKNGWGNPDDTADYTIKMVNDICKNYGADRGSIVLTGFSRGAIACGYIGLRNKDIASLWAAIHCCQHYDGDGWKGAVYKDAILRLKNGLNIPQFHTDNNDQALKDMLTSANINVTYAKSKLNMHACDMFLDNRPSTEKLRKWFWSIVLSE